MRSSPTKRIRLSALLMAVFGAVGFARAQAGARVDNWTVPEDSFKATDISRPVTFVAVALAGSWIRAARQDRMAARVSRRIRNEPST